VNLTGRLIYLALGAVIAAALMMLFAGDGRDAAVDQAAIDALRRAGYKPVEVGKAPPERLAVPELPIVADELAVLGFGVPFEGDDVPLVFFFGGPDPESGSDPDRPDGRELAVLELAPAPNWTLRPGDLALSEGRVSLVRVGSEPLASVKVDILARTPDGIVTRHVEAAEMDVDAWIERTAVPARGASLDIGFGVTTDADLELMGLWRREGRRWGWFGSYQHSLDAGGNEIGGGLAFHVGRR